MKKTHGFAAPHSRLQLLSFVALGIVCPSFYLFFTPPLDQTAVIVVDILYGVILAILFVFGTLTTLADPTAVKVEPGPDTFNCVYCRASFSSKSRHCRKCNRCTEGMDHHCKWFNNDVGSSNYNYFFVSVCSAVSLLYLQLVVGVISIVKLARDEEGASQNIQRYFNSSIQGSVFIVLISVIGLIVLGAAASLSHLLGFHLRLIYYQTTTYEYIMKQRDELSRQIAANAPRGIYVPPVNNPVVIPAPSLPVASVAIEMSTVPINIIPNPDNDKIILSPEIIKSSSDNSKDSDVTLVSIPLDTSASVVASQVISSIPLIVASDDQPTTVSKSESTVNITKEIGDISYQSSHKQVVMADPRKSLVVPSLTDPNCQSLSRHGSRFRIPTESVSRMGSKRSFKMSTSEIANLQFIADSNNASTLVLPVNFSDQVISSKINSGAVSPKVDMNCDSSSDDDDSAVPVKLNDLKLQL